MPTSPLRPLATDRLVPVTYRISAFDPVTGIGDTQDRHTLGYWPDGPYGEPWVQCQRSILVDIDGPGPDETHREKRHVSGLKPLSKVYPGAVFIGPPA